MVISLLSAFLSSLIVTWLLIRFESAHCHLSFDSDLLGPQKFHKFPVPRIGGISIAIGIAASILFRLQSNSGSIIEVTLLVCAMLAFAIGLAEDLTKKIGIKTRLTFIATAAGIAAFYLGAQIGRLDIPGIDHLLTLPGIAIIFSIFAITGLANAYNIIDGFNGLASMVGFLTLIGLTYISYEVGDPLMMYLCLVMAVSILGFFFWNFPRGLIFLGDGGAYLIGFWIGTTTIMLVSRHPNISPWFALLINAYPIMETLFTIYRRKIHQDKSPTLPDAIHFHTLVFRRILNQSSQAHKNNFLTANAKTSTYLWVLTMLAMVPAILWWQSTSILIFYSAIFAVSYIWLYKRIVTFKTPSWLHLY